MTTLTTIGPVVTAVSTPAAVYPIPEREPLMTAHDPNETFAPSPAFAEQANVGPGEYERAAADRLAFWDEQARRLDWAADWNEVLDWSDAPVAKWFVDGRLNASYNCVDRHVEAGNGDRVAIHWVGEPTDDSRDITYSDLKDEVSRTANYLSSLGLVAGDRVAIYMPLLPETYIAMLACARLGLTHSVVFAGFSSAALRSRVDDASAKVVITADGQFRRGKPAPLKAGVDEALGDSLPSVDGPADSVQKVLVVRRTGIDVDWQDDRDVWWDEVIPGQSAEHTPEAFDSEHPLFLLYTSGTTGKPKGIVHTTGGYLTQASYTHDVVFDHKPGKDVYWCTADVGWVTGHTYGVYGPLSNGATCMVYEGTPNSPNEHRHFEIIEKYGVSIYYAAPTLIRTFMKWGREIPKAHDLSSIRLLGSVGEPINPEAWRWYREHIGGDAVPIVDTWWQTETGAIMISPLPGVTEAKPGSAMRALPGINVSVVNGDAQEVPAEEQGFLVITEPWPAMLRGIWGDMERYRDTYWSRFAEEGYYFAGDGAKFDSDGALWVLGRVDDVMNISGHRISTSEVESALVGHDSVAEAAVVGANDETTGQAIVAFVILRESAPEDTDHHQALIDELRARVSTEISPIAKPRDITIVPELPKTRSGKIMRRLLKDLAEGRDGGDTSTLSDPTIMEQIRAKGTRG